MTIKQFVSERRQTNSVIPMRRPPLDDQFHRRRGCWSVSTDRRGSPAAVPPQGAQSRGGVTPADDLARCQGAHALRRCGRAVGHHVVRTSSGSTIPRTRCSTASTTTELIPLPARPTRRRLCFGSLSRVVSLVGLLGRLLLQLNSPAAQKPVGTGQSRVEQLELAGLGLLDLQRALGTRQTQLLPVTGDLGGSFRDGSVGWHPRTASTERARNRSRSGSGLPQGW